MDPGLSEALGAADETSVRATPEPVDGGRESSRSKLFSSSPSLSPAGDRLCSLVLALLRPGCDGRDVSWMVAALLGAEDCCWAGGRVMLPEFVGGAEDGYTDDAGA